MSARVFVHPRCVAGAAGGALAATLEEHGVTDVSIGPASKKGYCELVRIVETTQAGINLERMDGVRYLYIPPAPPTGGLRA